ncbi:adenylate kinase [Candidatus Aerophobetes bacterium]|nr:adenylate kinase [Candidatus Aerophobetes bacterium]
MRLVLLGPPAAGKGTQAEKLKKKFGLVHIATGDILRKAAEEKNPLGEKVRNFMEKGELVPDPLLFTLLENKLRGRDFVLDGFPRNLTQAEKLDRLLEDGIDLVINIKVDEKTVFERISRRLICPICGKIYREKKQKCDICGTKLFRRDDDNPETILKRIEVYKKYTYPLISYYEKKGILRHIQGNKSPEQIFQDILLLLKEEGIG